MKKNEQNFEQKTELNAFTLDKKCTLGGHHQMKKKAIGNARQQRWRESNNINNINERREIHENVKEDEIVSNYVMEIIPP